MMAESARRGTVFGADPAFDVEGNPAKTRFDLANLHIQDYGNTAIASYTLLISTGTYDGVTIAAHNESRVMVKIDGSWQVVHVHKSPAWPAPHFQP
jgi:ketosteroid isomerase-like protein